MNMLSLSIIKSDNLKLYLLLNTVPLHLTSIQLFLKTENPENLLETISRVLQDLECMPVSQYRDLCYQILPNTFKLMSVATFTTTYAYTVCSYFSLPFQSVN